MPSRSGRTSPQQRRSLLRACLLSSARYRLVNGPLNWGSSTEIRSTQQTAANEDIRIFVCLTDFLCCRAAHEDNHHARYFEFPPYPPICGFAAFAANLMSIKIRSLMDAHRVTRKVFLYTLQSRVSCTRPWSCFLARVICGSMRPPRCVVEPAAAHVVLFWSLARGAFIGGSRRKQVDLILGT